MREDLPVRFVRRAARQLRQASRWWEDNRPAAPGAVEEAVERALRLIRSTPGLGARATNVSLPGVRRVHLSRIDYHLYYRVSSNPVAIEVLALWHGRRGRDPKL